MDMLRCKVRLTFEYKGVFVLDKILVEMRGVSYPVNLINKFGVDKNLGISAHNDQFPVWEIVFDTLCYSCSCNVLT
jgi:hypothetical protein